MNKADFYIQKLGLNPHPEGGYFKEIYRSDEMIDQLPERYSGSRSFSTSIYFLLKGDQVSKLHKLKSDEVWHFYDGSSVKIYTFNSEGILNEIILGSGIEEGEIFQTVIEKENWFCAEVIEKDSFSLVGCTVAPGFDFPDFKLANRNELIEKYPAHKQLIKRFTV